MKLLTSRAAPSGAVAQPTVRKQRTKPVSAAHHRFAAVPHLSKEARRGANCTERLLLGQVVQATRATAAENRFMADALGTIVGGESGGQSISSKLRAFEVKSMHNCKTRRLRTVIKPRAAIIHLQFGTPRVPHPKARRNQAA